MAKGRAKSIKLKPAERDPFGKALDAWPESAWTSPIKEWSLTMFRADGGMPEEKKFEGTYQDMVNLRTEYIQTGIYYMGVAKHGCVVGNPRKWG